MSAERVIELAEQYAAQFVELRYCDSVGRWRHVTVPASGLTPERLQAGWLDRAGAVREGELALLKPAPETAHVDPFAQYATVALVTERWGADSGAPLEGEPRAIARRAVEAAAAAGVADEVRVATRLEFHVFDQASFEQGLHGAHYNVDVNEGQWRRGRAEPDNLGLQMPEGDALRRGAPQDALANLRSEMAAALEECGVTVTRHEHGLATGGQVALELAAAPLVTAADQIMLARYVARQVAARHGKVATFMAQPLQGDAGCTLSLALELRRGGAEVTLEDGAMAAFVDHLPSLAAFLMPTTNGYRRRFARPEGPRWLRAQFPDGVGLGVADVQTASTIDVSLGDPNCNPYLALAAVALALMDAAEHPGAGGSAGEAEVDWPHTLVGAVEALERDQGYLLRGNAFSAGFVNRWCTERRADAWAVAERPHPYEFCLYFAG